MSPEIILYSYDEAIHGQKILQFLALFKIPFKCVEIPRIMPRPKFAELGITYRRTPILSIGSDVYVDTTLIIEKLSDIAQHTSDHGLEDATNHIEFLDLGKQACQLAVRSIPLSMSIMTDPEFLADRTKMLGGPYDPQAIFPMIRPSILSSMTTLLNSIQSHFLKDDKKFFLGGSMPTTADMHLYWSLNWGLRYHLGSRPEISEATHPKIFEWMSAVESFLKDRYRRTETSIDEARQVLLVPPTHEYAKFVPHVENNYQGLQPGQKIKVTPEDNSRNYPQFGELISFNYEQVCLRNEKGLVMHFPRTGYEIEKA